VLVIGGFAWVVTGLPAFGHYHHRYGRVAARDAVPLRSVENAVNATAFDYRAFDTLGEEFILFISVVGVTILLRSLRGEDDPDRQAEAAGERRGSDLTRWLGAALVGPLLVLGADVVTHGQLSPGGGFQGGVILAAAVAVLFVGGQYRILLRLRAISTWVEVADSAGALGFVMIAFGGLIGTGTFLFNFLPKGTSGLLTGGIVPLTNVSVGIEVAGAVLMVCSELLQQRDLSKRA
jgi:multicomponent Na+:H+ antiporter subunit B